MEVEDANGSSVGGYSDDESSSMGPVIHVDEDDVTGKVMYGGASTRASLLKEASLAGKGRGGQGTGRGGARRQRLQRREQR